MLDANHFFCNVVPNEDEDHFSKTYKLVENKYPKDILALASIANSGFSFGSYENKPINLRNSGYNEDFPSIMLLAFGVRRVGCVEVFNEEFQDEVESMFIDVWQTY